MRNCCRFTAGETDDVMKILRRICWFFRALVRRGIGHSCNAGMWTFFFSTVLNTADFHAPPFPVAGQATSGSPRGRASWQEATRSSRGRSSRVPPHGQHLHSSSSSHRWSVNHSHGLRHLLFPDYWNIHSVQQKFFNFEEVVSHTWKSKERCDLVKECCSMHRIFCRCCWRSCWRQIL